MKSKISLFNQAVFKRNLTGSWFLWAALLLFYLLLLPVNVYGSLSETLRYSAQTDSVLLSSQLACQMLAGMWNMNLWVPFFALAAILCAMNVFSYLFTARNSNMMHTYPVSRISLFVTNYVTGILFLLVPILLAALLTMGVGAVYGAVDGSVAKYCLIWMATVSVENLFFFSMSVCVLMFVGNMAAVPVLYLILNFLYDGCILIAETVVSTVCYGLENDLLSRSGLSALTPIIYMTRIGAGDDIAYNESGAQCTLSRMYALPGYFAAAVLFAVIALIVYQKKHIETAGDVITVKWLKPIFRWGAAICTSALGALFFTSIFNADSFLVIISSAAVIGILVFFLAQMLLERSVHIFSKGRIRECILYTAVVCACYLALDLDVLGMEKKIPAENEIQAVRTLGSIYLLAQDEEQISWVCDIHSQIIASKAEFEREANNNRSIEYLSLEYLLKDGSIFRRSYGIPDLKEAGSVSAQIREYAGRPEVILRQYFGIHYPDIEIYGGRWSMYTDDGNVREVRVSEADAKQFYEAVVLDVCSGNIGGAPDEGPVAADTAEIIGDLALEVRDEAGFVTPMDYYSIRNSDIGKGSKDGTAYISVHEGYGHLLKKMQELGYLSP